MRWVGYWPELKARSLTSLFGIFPSSLCLFSGSLSFAGAAFLSTGALVMSSDGSQEKGSLLNFRKSRSQIKEAPRIGFWAPGYLQGGWSSRLRKKHKWSEEADEVSFSATLGLDTTFQNPGASRSEWESGIRPVPKLTTGRQHGATASDPPSESGSRVAWAGYLLGKTLSLFHHL